MASFSSHLSTSMISPFISNAIQAIALSLSGFSVHSSFHLICLYNFSLLLFRTLCNLIRNLFALLGFWNHLWLSFRRFLHCPCVYQKQYHKLTHYSSQKFTFYKSPGFPFLESINEPSGWRSVPKASVTQMGWISQAVN